MSGLPWIRLYRDVAAHPKLVQLEDALGPGALAHVVKLWCAAAAYYQDGTIKGSPAMVARFAGWAGDPEALLSALIACGLFEASPDGLVCHDWWEHQGAHIEKAEKDAERKRTARGRRADGARTSTGQDTDGRAPEAVMARVDQSRVEEIRKDKIIQGRGRARGIHGLIEQEAAPQDPRMLLKELKNDHAREWHRVASLDGRSGRKTHLEVLQALWPNFTDQLEQRGLQVAMARAWAYLLTDAGRVWGQWERDPNKISSYVPKPGELRDRWIKGRGAARMFHIKEIARSEGVQVPRYASDLMTDAGRAWAEWINSMPGQSIRDRAHEIADKEWEAQNGLEPKEGAA